MFFLHPTFHNPVREVLQHPFEIEEHGWGEFELSAVVRPTLSLPSACCEAIEPRCHARACSPQHGAKGVGVLLYHSIGWH